MISFIKGGWTAGWIIQCNQDSTRSTDLDSKAFGTLKDDWSDDVADAFRKLLQVCDEANPPSGYFWDELGPQLKEQRAAAVGELEYARQAEQRQIEQAARDKKAVEDSEAERDRFASARRAADAERNVIALRVRSRFHCLRW